MTRRQMIEVLIEDRLHDWVFARNYDGLEEILWDGWKGYGEYSDKELLEEIEMRFEPDYLDHLIASINWRKEEERKIEEDEKKGIKYKLPWE